MILLSIASPALSTVIKCGPTARTGNAPLARAPVHFRNRGDSLPQERKPQRTHSPTSSTSGQSVEINKDRCYLATLSSWGGALWAHRHPPSSPPTNTQSLSHCWYSQETGVSNCPVLVLEERVCEAERKIMDK